MLNIAITVIIAFILCYGIGYASWHYGYGAKVAERGSHKNFTPYGGGIVIFFLLAFSMIMLWSDYIHFTKMFVGFCLIFLISAWDDWKPTSWALRIIIHFISCALAIAFISAYTDFNMHFHWLMQWIDEQTLLVLLPLSWLVYINYSNFIDGLDGISALNSLFVICALLWLDYESPALFGVLAHDMLLEILCGTMLAFLFWNRHPAKLFLGDSGAIILGFIQGLLLLILAGNGAWSLALILCAYPICECSVTMLWRLKDKKTLWESHRDYSFHLQVGKGESHWRALWPLILLHLGLLSIFAFGLYIHDVIACIMAYMLSLAYLLHIRLKHNK
jgi:UDP-N-acetylmuramyl pentapeptide phosphotransferase/UDP-N-acetylglucosamine-1-phosphate transferase